MRSTAKDNRIAELESKELVENILKEKGYDFLTYWVPLKTSEIMRKVEKKWVTVSYPYTYPKKFRKNVTDKYCSGFLIGHPLGDHFRKVKFKEGWKTNKWVLQTHPYHGDMEDFKELIKVCEERNLTFHVRGTSSYFTGHTFSIYIMEKEDYDNEKNG